MPKAIEAAHFAEDVIEACQVDAREMDYDLSVEVYRPGESKQAAYGSMTLTYDYGISFLIWKIPEGLRWIYGKGEIYAGNYAGLWDGAFYSVIGGSICGVFLFWQYRHFVCKERRSGMKRDYGYLWGNVASGRYDRHVGILFWQEIKSPFGMGLALALEQMFG